MKLYGSLELSAEQSAVPEIIKLPEVKTYLRIDPGLTIEDKMLGLFISAARSEAERLQGKELIAKQYDLNIDLLMDYAALSTTANPLRLNYAWNLGVGYEIELKHPLQSVDLFQYKDSSGNVTALVENTDYIVDTNRSLVTPPFGRQWPYFVEYPSSAVLIRFTSGYPAGHPFWLNEGSKIMVGMWMLIAHWYENRDVLNAGGSMKEYPYSVTELLQGGARPRVF